MITLAADSTVDTLALRPEAEPVPADQRIEGDPSTAVLELGTVGGLELGVWEMSEGVARDVETDEVFVVVAGHAEVHVEGRSEPLQLAPGVVGRLQAGTKTVWTVTETLRKVYVLGR